MGDDLNTIQGGANLIANSTILTSHNNILNNLVRDRMDTQSSINATFEFYYHMFGLHTGVLKVYWQDGNKLKPGSLKELTITLHDEGGTTTTSLSGAQQSSSSDAWKRATADITSTTQSGKVVFLYYKTSDGFRGDIALDRFNITGGINSDLDVTTNSSTGVDRWLAQKIPVTGIPDGGDAFSVATAVSHWEAGNHIVGGGISGDLVDLSTSNNNLRTSYWILRSGNTPSLNTGPNSGADGVGDYYIYVETSNNSGPGNSISSTMYYENNYIFLCTK